MERNNETILMGDFNFDFNSIYKTENEKSQTEKNLIKCTIPLKIIYLQKYGSNRRM